MGSVLSIPKHIARSVWKVIKVTGQVILAVFELIVWPISKLSQLFD